MDKKKIEIEIPEGWEVDEPDIIRRVYVDQVGILNVTVGVHKIDPRERWQKKIDDVTSRGVYNASISTAGDVFIPPGVEIKEYKGWKYCNTSICAAIGLTDSDTTDSKEAAPIPAWVTDKPHREGYDWRAHDSTGQLETKTMPVDFFSSWDESRKWLLENNNIFKWLDEYCPRPKNWRNERYHYENGRWVHKPYGTMPGEKP